jgi:NAD-dependent DNA ligase
VKRPHFHRGLFVGTAKTVHFAFCIAQGDEYQGPREKLVNHLVDHGIIETPADLYKLDSTVVAALERMAENRSQLDKCDREEQGNHAGKVYHALGIATSARQPPGIWRGILDSLTG